MNKIMKKPWRLLFIYIPIFTLWVIFVLYLILFKAFGGHLVEEK